MSTPSEDASLQRAKQIFLANKEVRVGLQGCRCLPDTTRALRSQVAACRSSWRKCASS